MTTKHTKHCIPPDEVGAPGVCVCVGDEWDEYEEDGPMDLEDQLDAAFARADAQKQK